MYSSIVSVKPSFWMGETLVAYHNLQVDYRDILLDSRLSISFFANSSVKLNED